MVTISHEVEFEFDAGEYWEEIFVKYYQQIREK